MNDSGVPASASHPHTLRAGPRLGDAARVFGYDIFISFALGPPPRGSRAYAADLARRLREADFTVFFSEEEAPAGDVLDATLRRALLRSRTLVVVLNRATLTEPRWVRTEVETFRQAHPARPVVPISIGGAIGDAELAAAAQSWLQHDQRIWIDEAESAWQEGRVSDEVLARLATAPRAVRAATRWRGLVGATVAVLAGIAVIAWWQRGAALEALRGATALRLVAESEAMLAGTRAGGDERALQQLVVAHRLAPGPEVAAVLQAAAVRHRDLLRIATLPGRVRQLLLDAPRGRLYAAVAGHGVQLLAWPSLVLVDGAPLAPGEDVVAMALSPDGTRLATATRRLAANTKPLRVWNVATGAALGGEFDLPEPTAMALGFSADGATLLVAGPAYVRRFDAKSGALLGASGLFTKASLTAMALDATRGHVLSGGYFGPASREAVLWDATDGRPLATWNVEGCDTEVVAFTPDGSPLTGGGYVDLFPNGSCVLTPGSTFARRWSGHPEPVRALVARDGLLVTGDEGGALIAWFTSDADSKPFSRAAQGHRGAVRALLVTDQPRAIVSAGDDGTLRVYRRAFADPMTEQIALGESAVGESRLQVRLNFRADGSISEETVYPLRQAVFMVDARSGRGFGVRVDGNDGALQCIEYLPGGHELLAVRRGEVVRLRADGSMVDAPALQERPKRASCAAASPDGRVFAAGDASGALHLWDAASGRRLRPPIPAHDGALTTLRFTPNGQRVATGGADARVRLWDVESGAAVGAPMVGPEAVGALDIDPQGRTLVAGHTRSGVQFWDLAGQRPIGVPMSAGSFGGLGGVAFSGDGRHVVAATSRSGLRNLPAPPTWNDVLCAKLARAVTVAELKEWVPAALSLDSPCAGAGGAEPKASSPGAASR